MATDAADRQQALTFTKEIRKTLSAGYLLYLPKGYEDEESKAWPLMLFLHGAGERGSDLARVKLHGPPKRVEEGEEFPFVLVSPQCPEKQWWSVELLDHLLNEVAATHRIDEDRVYVTGLSMGGYGTWDLAMAYPDRFAALAPVCGGGSPHKTRLLTHVPIWVFHGAKDQTVPLTESELMVEALKKFDGEVKLTVYPEAQHDSWTETYENPELYDWFLKQRRGGE